MRRWTTGVVLLALSLGLGWLGWWWYAAGTPEALLRKGRLALQHRDYPQAESCERQLEAKGFKDHALLLRGETKMQLGAFAQALQFFNQIRDLEEIGQQAMGPSARCLLELGELQAAEQAYAVMLPMRPDDLDAHRGLTAVYHDMGDQSRAIHHGEQWARLAPTDGRPCRLVGLIYKDMGQFQPAIENYKAALSRELKDPVREEVRQELAECLLQGRDYSQALAELQFRPTRPAVATIVLVLQAECLRGLNRGDEALALAEKATRIDPKNAHAWRLRGQLLVEADRGKEALDLLRTAAELDPADYETHNLLAQIYTRLGNPREAEEQRQLAQQIRSWMDELTRLTREVMQKPRDAGLHKRMAEVYEKMSLPEMAERCRRRAKVLTPAPAGK